MPSDLHVIDQEGHIVIIVRPMKESFEFGAGLQQYQIVSETGILRLQLKLSHMSACVCVCLYVCLCMCVGELL